MNELDKFEKTSAEAARTAKEDAINHIIKISDLNEENANILFDSIRTLTRNYDNMVINTNIDIVEDFIKTGNLQSIRNYKMDQAEEILGIKGLVKHYALVCHHPQGNKHIGKCSIIIDNPKETLYINGDIGRIRNPSRVDFLENPFLAVVANKYIDVCRASSIVRSLRYHDLSGGIAVALSSILDENNEIGPSQALILRDINQFDVIKILVSDIQDRDRLRNVLGEIKRLLPIEISLKEPRIQAPFWQSEEPDVMQERVTSPLTFAIGDAVCLKPMASNPIMDGHITNIADGKIIVQWHNGNKTMFDLAEALLRLMPKPNQDPIVLDVVSSLPDGMTNQAFSALYHIGIDPIGIASLTSTFSSPGEIEEKEFINNAIEMGLEGNFQDGFALDSSNGTYISHRWFESLLPGNHRLIIDLYSNQPLIKISDSMDYIILPEFTSVPME